MSKTILNNIKILASKKNISLAKLESDCGLGNGTISKWENGNPTISSMEKVANYLDCKIQDLLNE